jgi:hypothetical protein
MLHCVPYDIALIVYRYIFDNRYASVQRQYMRDYVVQKLGRTNMSWSDERVCFVRMYTVEIGHYEFVAIDDMCNYRTPADVRSYQLAIRNFTHTCLRKSVGRVPYNYMETRLYPDTGLGDRCS